MAYYDNIAKQWHQATGFKGGSFKRHVLNPFLLEKLGDLAGQSVLELGAGNGYFLPMVIDRSSGRPKKVVVSDVSAELLTIAQRNFFIPDATYHQLDVRRPFPFTNDSFDIILATMIFNELSTPGLKKALRSCQRVLRQDGVLLMTITHPDFIANLNKRDQLKTERNGTLTMPGTKHLRLPIVPRPLRDYHKLLPKFGFTFMEHALFANDQIIKEKSGLAKSSHVPIALVFACQPVGKN